MASKVFKVCQIWSKDPVHKQNGGPFLPVANLSSFFSKDMFSFSKCVSKCAFIYKMSFHFQNIFFKMSFHFQMCVHFQNVFSFAKLWTLVVDTTSSKSRRYEFFVGQSKIFKRWNRQQLPISKQIVDNCCLFHL